MNAQKRTQSLISKIQLLTIFFCFVLVKSYAQNAPYTLTVDDVDFENGVITNYTNTTEKDIIIPDNFNGEAVTEIGEEAFLSKGITAVILPNTIQFIGERAFEGNSISSLSLPMYQGDVYSWNNDGNDILISGDELIDFSTSYTLDKKVNRIFSSCFLSTMFL